MIRYGIGVVLCGLALIAGADYEDSFLDGLTEVRFVLSPVKESRIRVIAFLPDKAKWNGRLVMRGSGGGAGFIDTGCKHDALAGAIGCYCDMGTGRPWQTEPREVITDFGHRATHEAVKAVKELAQRFYGEKPRWCYFFGSSTGGCQGFAEVERYPDDFDGVVAGVPAAARIASAYYFAWLGKQILNADGSEFLKESYFSWLKEAALEYFSDKDCARARNRFLTDSRYTPERYAKIFALAKAKHPELADPEVAARLKAVFSGAYLNGRLIQKGAPLATVPPLGASLIYFQMFHQWKFGKGTMPHAVTDAMFEEFIADYRRDVDQVSTDLDRWRARGGKMLVYSGLADPIVPPFEVMDWYDGLIDRYGSADEVRKFVRYYLLPGRGHGVHGFGEKSAGVSRIIDEEGLVMRWVEQGEEPPLVLPGEVPGEEHWPLKPYPDNFQ